MTSKSCSFIFVCSPRLCAYRIAKQYPIPLITSEEKEKLSILHYVQIKCINLQQMWKYDISVPRMSELQITVYNIHV